LSFGALMGARGNSGVIASQIMRGIAEGLAAKRHFNALDLAHALTVGTQTAYAAVGQPVEGTILTVIREAAAAAVTAAERDPDIESVLAATVEAAERSVARTPSLLAILREAGVVDSGGQGLYRLLQGAHRYVADRSAGAARGRAKPAAGARVSTLVAHADEGFGYETMFLLQPSHLAALDVDTIRDHLESIGDSVLVAGDARALKVHVHNDRPDLVIGYGLTMGALSRISVENLDHQARDVRETRAVEFTGVSTESAAGSNGSSGPADLPALGVLAVAAGDGLAAIFRDFGVAGVVHGGQSANPSTGELLGAIQGVNAREVIVLPNNPNVVLAARQVASLSDRPVAVVPTRNAAEGFAALLALDPHLDAATNASQMTDAARAIQTLVVTEAVRDATIGGRKVKRGQTIALDPDDGLVAADNDREKCVLAAVASLTAGFELVTLFYGDGADLAEAEAMARRIGSVLPAVDVEVRHGGQPYYRYLIAAE
ncbi:MAG: DAK2 domain-containing protein, partial [Chloroflexi bacterium]|nr:DAK2 domain-containing protein [Chloroflexota bacterium]